MSYDIKLVSIEGLLGGLTLVAGAVTPPTPFSFFLFNSWYCLKVKAPDGRANVVYSIANNLKVEVSNDTFGGQFCTVQLTHYDGRFYTPFFTGEFSLPADVQWNIQVSVNCDTQVVQVYCNDAPCTRRSGGFLGAHTQMPGGATHIAAVSVGAGPEHDYPAIADLWAQATLSWIDLSVESNRRKFTNADLTPVDLGSDGSNPFGTAPPVFLKAPGVATDLATNYGTAGAFTVSGSVALAYQPPTCPVPYLPPTIPPPEPEPEPSPPPPPLLVSHGLRERTYRHRFLGRSFDPTIVITKDRPGPLRIVEFEAWMME